MADKDNKSSATGTAPSADNGESKSSDAPVAKAPAPPSFETVKIDGADHYVVPINATTDVNVPIADVKSGKATLPTAYVPLETVG